MWLCAVAMLFLVIKWAAESPKEDSLLEQTESLLGRENSEITLTGHVSQCSRTSQGIRLSLNQITYLTGDNSEISVLPEYKIIVTTEYKEISPGDTVTVRGLYQKFAAASNPGQFDLRSWYFSQKIVGRLSKPQLITVLPGEGGWNGWLYGIRSAMMDSFERILPEKEAYIMSAISLGEKSVLENEWKLMYQEGGIAHILAVSSLHVTLVGMLFYRLLKKAFSRFSIAAIGSGAVAAGYVVMTGASVSAVRAGIMFLIWLGAQVAGRKYDLLTGTAAAAAVILAGDGGQLTQTSFLLSFGAILTLACFIPAVVSTCEIRRGVSRSFFTCLGVWIGTLPCTLVFFYQVSPWSILVNAAVVALMSSLMTLGLLGAVAGIFVHQAGVFLASPAVYLLGIFEALCRIQQKLPLPVWVAGKPSVTAVIVYCLLWIAVLMALHFLQIRKVSAVVRRLAFAVCTVMCLLVIGWRKPQNEVEIVCMDVGQGDSALLRLPGDINCLIDCGSSSESGIWQYRVSQTVKYYGINRLDYVFLSHADQDHMNGLEEYLEQYAAGFGDGNVHGITLGALVLPKLPGDDFDEVRRLASRGKIKVLEMETGMFLAGGGEKGQKKQDDWTLRCLSPDAGRLAGDKNEDSLVMLLQYGAFRMLFTGDIGSETEQRLLASGADVRADVLKVAHHGSGGSSSEPFLEAVSAQAAVISCGRNNRYGHPSAVITQRLGKFGSRIFETPDVGAVSIYSDGKEFSIETYSGE